MKEHQGTGSIVRRFTRYYRPHRGLFVLDMSMAAARAGMGVMIPVLVRAILKDYLPAHDLKATIVAIGGIMVLTFLSCAAAYVNTRWGHVLGTRMETDMRSDLFGHLQKLSFSYFDRTKTGHIMSRISNDLFTISETAHHLPEELFTSVCMTIGAFFFMFRFNPPLAVVSLIPLPLMVMWGMIYRSRMRNSFRRVRERIADINSNVENAIQGIREVKAFTNEDYEIEKFYEVNREFRSAKEGMYRTMAGFHAGMLFLVDSYFLVVIGGGALLMHFGRIDLADVVTFLIYARFMVRPIRQMVGFIEQYQEGAAAFERFTEIMDVEPDITDRPSAVRLEGIRGDITFDHVWFKYDGSPDWVLRNVNIRIEKGRRVALVGESGAGKSTLASLVPRFYEAQKGRLLIDGHDVTGLQRRSLREGVGLVQQTVFLFDSTIRENIMFGRPEASEEEVMEAARRAHILPFIESLPDGLDSLVGEHGVKLSGGQRQRVSIARVFLKDPPILIFDEATSSLDSESEGLIRAAMEELCRDRTTIIIAHRLSTVQWVDHTYVVMNGSVVEEGSHEELLAGRGHYHALYESSLF